MLPGGEVVELSIPEPDLEQALGWIKRINALETSEGAPVSSLVTVNGFEPWWFVQDQVFTHLLVPYTRYREVLEWWCQGAEIVEPPPELARLQQVLAANDKTLEEPMKAAVGSSARRVLGALASAGRTAFSLKSALWFRLRRRPVLLYAIDVVSPGLRHDFRLDPIYRELDRRGLRYGEYLHSLGGWGAWRNSWRRRRVGIDIGAGTSPWGLRSPSEPLPGADVVLEGFSGDEERLVRAVVREALDASRRAAERYRGLVALVRFHRPRVALILDDSRHAHELIAACRELGVYVVSYQHGLAFNRYFVGLMCYGFRDGRRHRADVYGLWSEYFRQRLLMSSQLHDESSTFVCGMLRAPDVGSSQERSSSENGRVRVQVISESLGRTAEIVTYIEKLVDAEQFDVTLKLRPGENVVDEWLPLCERGMKTTRASVYEALADCDVVIGTYSSVLYEAALVPLPLVVPRTSSPFGFELGEEGLAELADSPEEVRAAVLRAVALSPDELERRRERIWGDASSEGAKRVLDRVTEALTGTRSSSSSGLGPMSSAP